VVLLRRFEPTLRMFKMHAHGMAAWLMVREALGRRRREIAAAQQRLARDIDIGPAHPRRRTDQPAMTLR
jgi:hypothetical protein